MKKLILTCLVLNMALGVAAEAGRPPWQGDLLKVLEEDGVSYSIFIDRTKMVDDFIPGADQVAETYVYLEIPGQNLLEIQQWNIRPGGDEYRVQDSLDLALDTLALVDQ